MSVTVTLNASLSVPGMAAGSIAITADIQSQLNYDWVSAPTNHESDIFIPTANGRLKGLWIMSNKAGTLYTNAASSGSPTNTIALTASTPILWVPGSGTQPLASSPDVTKVYFTSAIAAGHLDIVALYTSS